MLIGMVSGERRTRIMRRRRIRVGNLHFALRASCGPSCLRGLGLTCFRLNFKFFKGNTQFIVVDRNQMRCSSQISRPIAGDQIVYVPEVSSDGWLSGHSVTYLQRCTPRSKHRHPRFQKDNSLSTHPYQQLKQ